jgi:hypothetical protein
MNSKKKYAIANIKYIAKRNIQLQIQNEQQKKYAISNIKFIAKRNMQLQIQNEE